MNFASSQVQTLVSNTLAQSTTAKGTNNKVQTTGTQQAQATALVAGKPIMPTQAIQAGATPIVLGQLSMYHFIFSFNSTPSLYCRLLDKGEILYKLPEFWKFVV